MKIHINRDGKSLGKFDPAEVRARLVSGEFLETDLAWHDGMDSWLPLSECIDEIAPEQPAARAVAAHENEGLPWERREQSGFLTALAETVRIVLLEPALAFSSMKPLGGYGAPLFFAVMLGSLGALADLCYNLALRGKSALPLSAMGLDQAAVGAAIGGAIVLLPILMAVGTFLNAAIFHLLLVVVGGAHKPYESTFRTLAYCSGSAAVIRLLPGCGSIISGIWFLVILIVGLAVVHGIGRGRAALAVLLAFAAVCAAWVFCIAGTFALLLTPAQIQEFMRALSQG